jgi:hypothetical protein
MRRLRSIVPIAVVFFRASAAAAQTLPDPHMTFPLTPPVAAPQAVSVNAAPRLPSDAEVDATVERAKSAVAAMADSVVQKQNAIAGLDNKVAKLNDDERKLRAELDRVLDDLRKGLFCSTCGRAKSEFGSDAEFWQHIREGAAEGRHAVAATKEQREAKERQYAARLAALDTERSQIATEREKAVAEMQSLYEGMRQAVEVWRVAAAARESFIIGREQEARANDARDLQKIDEQLRSLNDVQARPAPFSAEALAAADAHRRMLESMKLRINEDAAFRTRAYFGALAEAQKRSLDEYGEVVGSVRRTDPISQAFTLLGNPVMPISVNMPFASVSSNDSGVSVAAFGASASLGPSGASAGISLSPVVTIKADTRMIDGVSMEVRAYAEILGRLRIGAINTTRYTPSGGVLTEPSVFVDITPPKDPTSPKIEPVVIEEKNKVLKPKP